MAVGDVAAYILGSAVEYEWGSQVSLIVFLVLYFAFLWVPWILAVWVIRTGNHLIGRPKIAEVERSVCRVQSPLVLAPLRRGFSFGRTRRRGSHQCDLPFSRNSATCTTSVGRRIKGGTVDRQSVVSLP